MKPFPFARYPHELKKRLDWSSLATTNGEEEASRPYYRGMVASRAESEPDFTDDGEGFHLPPADQKNPYFPMKTAALRWLVRRPALEGAKWDSSKTTHGSIASVILPRSIRRFLRRRGYKDSQIDKIIADNYTAHQADIERARQSEVKADPKEIHRRPVYLFDPDVHERMMNHLNSGTDVFREGGSKTPIEVGGSLIGSLSIDPEHGTPFVHISDYIPITHVPKERLSTFAVLGFTEIEHSNKVAAALQKSPHLFLVGHAHAHPPGATPVPSSGDMQVSMSGHQTNHPYSLEIVHSPNTIEVDYPDEKGVKISGPEAEEYLRAEGKAQYLDNKKKLKYTNYKTLFNADDFANLPYNTSTTTGFYNGYHGRKNEKGFASPFEPLGYSQVLSTTLPKSGGYIPFSSQVQFMGTPFHLPNFFGVDHRAGITLGKQQAKDARHDHGLSQDSALNNPPSFADTTGFPANHPLYAEVAEANADYRRRMAEDPTVTIRHTEEMHGGIKSRPRSSAPPSSPARSFRPLPEGSSPKAREVIGRIRAERESPLNTTISRLTRAFPFAVYPHEVLNKSERHGQGMLAYYRTHEPESLEASMEPGKIYGTFHDDNWNEKAIHIADEKTLSHFLEKENPMSHKGLIGFFGKKGLLRFKGHIAPWTKTALSYARNPYGVMRLTRKQILNPERNLHISWLEGGRDEWGEIGEDRIDHPNTQRQLFDALHAAGIKTITSDPISFSRAKLFTMITDKFHKESGGLDREPLSFLDKYQHYGSE